MCPDSTRRQSNLKPCSPYTLPIAKETVFEALQRHQQYRPNTPAVITGPTGVGKGFVVKMVVPVHPLEHVTGARLRSILKDEKWAQACHTPKGFESKAIVSALTAAEDVTPETADEKVGLFRQRPGFGRAQGVLDLHLLTERQQIGVAAQLSYCEAINELQPSLRILTVTSLADVHPMLREMLLDNDFPVPFPTPDEARHHLQRALECAGVEIADAALLDMAAQAINYRPDRLAHMGLRLRSLGFQTLTEEALVRHLGCEPETLSQITAYDDPNRLEDF